MTSHCKPSLWLSYQIAARLNKVYGTHISYEDQSALREGLERWKSLKLKETVMRAKTHSACYRKSLADFNILAGESLEELLARLPFTLPEELAATPESFLAVSHDEVDGVISLPTSGTSGPGGLGKRIFSTDRDLEETVAFYAHGLRFMIEPFSEDRVAVLMSGGRPGSVGELLSRTMRAMQLPCLVHGMPQDQGQTLKELIAFAPTCIIGAPAHILALSKNPAAAALKPNLRSVLLSGDIASVSLRAAIAENFECAAFLHYGLTETGLGGAMECQEAAITPASPWKNYRAAPRPEYWAGCHMREADLLFEIVNPQGRALAPGQWGEIVITTLTREAMPLIRYRTGDLGRILPDPCRCDSILHRLEPRGRLDDAVILPAGQTLHRSALDDALHALPWLCGYLAAQHTGRPGGLALELFTVPNPPEHAAQEAKERLDDLFASKDSAHSMALRIRINDRQTWDHAAPFASAKGRIRRDPSPLTAAGAPDL